MSINKFTVSRDDNIYEAWPDVTIANGGKLICVYSECKHHLDRGESRFMLRTSMDRGRTWSQKQAVSGIAKDGNVWDCARISQMSDGCIVIVGDYVVLDENNNDNKVYMWKSKDNGKSFEGPFETPVRGIVPDKLCEIKSGKNSGRYLLSAHTKSPKTGKLEQALWYSDNKGESWSDRIIVASDERYNLCEASILELKDGTLVAFMRENSGVGYDCFKSFSYDSGMTWDGVYNMPVPGCHRPVSGILQSGEVMLTYRFYQGGRGWGSFQNVFAAVTSQADAAQKERGCQAVRIVPLDNDRNKVADTGYTGWVQFKDGEIYMVNYIMDDAPKAYIRGYSFYEKDIMPL